jgi:hypothetical protein
MEPSWLIVKIKFNFRQLARIQKCSIKIDTQVHSSEATVGTECAKLSRSGNARGARGV